MSKNKSDNKQLSLLQTLQLSWYAIPSFKTTVVIAAGGIVTVFLVWFLTLFGISLQIGTFAGAIISFIGFDEMSKIVSQVSKEGTWEDYEENVLRRKG